MKRPERRNSMIPEFWDELPALVRALDGEHCMRAIVISSTGPHFCSGLDLKAFAPGRPAADEDPVARERRARQRGAEFYANVRRMQETFNVLEDCRIPVLAAIQGGCIGGGVDLATACDMRYCSIEAFFVIQEINIGMTADVGTFPRLVKLIPEGLVREMAYTGRRMSAQEAVAAGLVNRVYENHEEMIEAVLAIAREISHKAPLAIYGTKRMINYSRDHSTQDALDYIGIWNASMLQPMEMKEAIAANSEARSGDFVDLPRLRSTQVDDSILD
jgi:enoyl-CoA hydratase